MTMNAQSVTYKIALSGTIIEGHDEAEVKQRLVKALKLEPSKLDALWQKAPVIIARNLSDAKAKKYQQNLGKLGAEAKVIKQTPSTPTPVITKSTQVERGNSIHVPSPQPKSANLPVWMLIPLVLVLAGVAYIVLLNLPQNETNNPFDNNEPVAQSPIVPAADNIASPPASATKPVDIAPEPEAKPERKNVGLLADLRPQMRAEAWKALAYSPDGKYFVAAGDDVLLFDAKTRRVLKKLPPANGTATALAFSHDSRLLAVEYRAFDTDLASQSYAYRIALFSLPNSTMLHQFKTVQAHYNTRRAIYFSPDSQQIASSNEKMIAVYTIQTGKMIWQWEQDNKNNPHSSYSAVDVTPDWKYFLFNLERISYPSAVSSSKARYSDSSRPFFWINHISPDGKQAVAVGGSNGVDKKIFDLDTGKLLHQYTGAPTTRLAVNADFTMFAGEAEIWYPQTNRSVLFKPYSNSIEMALALSPDGKELSIGNLYFEPGSLPTDAEVLKQLRSWSPEWKETIHDWMPSSFARVYAEYSFAEKQQIQTKVGNSIRLFDLNTQKWVQDTQRVAMQSRPTGFHFSAKAFSPNQRYAVNDEAKLLYHRSAGNSPVRLISEAELNNQRGKPLFINNQTVLFVTNDSLYQIDITRKEPLAHLSIHAEHIKDMAISSHQRYVMLLEEHWDFIGKQFFAVYDLQAQKTLIPRTLGQAGGAIFSPNGQYWLRFYGKTIDIYNVSTGQIQQTLTIDSGRILSLSMSNDGQYLISTNINGLGEVYQLENGNKLYTLVANDLYNLVAFDQQGEPLDFIGQLEDMFYDR